MATTAATTTENLRILLVLAVIAGCGGGGGDAATTTGPESWSVTAWGGSYEVFPEVDALVAGTPAEAHTHVTVLDGFTPLAEGTVEIVLRGDGGEQTYSADAPTRPGIFTVRLTPETAGEYDLAFRIRSAAGSEEIRGGRVRVGTPEVPGGVVRAPAPRGAGAGAEPLPFLKEQQWRADFGTAWVREGALLRSAQGLARVRPPAGGEATVTAPVDGVLLARPWPYPGASVQAGEPLFGLVPRVAAERSLPDLRAEVESLEVELATSRARLGRLEELLEVEATSRREVEEERARVATIEARLGAARGDLAAARGAREGRSTAGGHTLRAPISGAVATVSASPGAAVAAGEALARVVRIDRAWIEVELPPAGARGLAAGGPRGLVVQRDDEPALEIPGEAVRLVSVAPEVDPGTGTVRALFEVPALPLPLGVTAEVEVLLAGERPGVAIPTTGLVDDGGVTVVYLQLSGERFVRQEVEVVARQGDSALVEGLVPGQRLVTRGGAAIRRATLLSTGQAQGHVH